MFNSVEKEPAKFSVYLQDFSGEFQICPPEFGIENWKVMIARGNGAQEREAYWRRRR